MEQPQFIVRSDPYTYDIVEKTLRAFARPATDRLLDIGCGSGAFLHHIDGMVAERHGCDFNIRQYAEPGNASNIKRVDLNTEPLPYADNSFDIATCLDVLEHVLSPYQIVAEGLRVLKPGGRFIISTPNVVNFVNRLRFFFTGSLQGFWVAEHSKENGERHISPIFGATLRDAIDGKASVVSEEFNRTVVPKLRLELPWKNLLLSETVIWTLQKNT